MKNNGIHYYNAFKSDKFAMVMVHALFYLALYFNQKGSEYYVKICPVNVHCIQAQ